MPESNTDHIDYYPEGWSEEKHSEEHIVWIYKDDEDVFVRVKPDDREGEYITEAIVGINNKGEEYQITTHTGMEKEHALRIAISLVYTINASYKRAQGDPEFVGQPR